MDNVSDSPLQALLVDDNATNIALASALLKKFKLDATIASDGQQAVGRSKEKRYDVILMDCLMPNMDGYEATTIIRQDPQNPNSETPIIALTGNASPEDREACLSAGMSDFLEKPLRPMNLIKVLGKWTHFTTPS
ncbi:MAG: response regulator [Verrucomicrobiota bacterium]